MHRIFIVMLFALVTTFNVSNAQAPDAPAVLAQAPKHDLSTPEAAVRSFAAAVTLHDANRALACVYKANTRTRGELVKQMQWGEKVKESYSIVDVDIVIQDVPHRALVIVQYTYKRADPQEARPVEIKMEEPLLLVRPQEDWQILSGDPHDFATPAQGSFLQMMATKIAHPEVSEAALRCQSRAEDIASQVIYYISRKYDGKLAVKQKAQGFKVDTPGAEKWSLLKRALVPEFNANMGPNPTRIFHCPADGDNYEKESYSFNEKLDGVSVAEIAEPANTVLIYEGKDGQLNFRHDCRATVAFVDGRVELINEEQAKTLRWTP